jgi:hypothetical protein
VLAQHLALERIGLGRHTLMRLDHLHALAAERILEHRQRDEQPLAIARKTLGLDDRPGVRRRREVQIGHVLVRERARNQKRCVRPECRLDIPARQVATGGEAVAGGHRRTDQQNRADRRAAALQQVAILRQVWRRPAFCQLRQRAPPECGAAAGKSARQQRGDCRRIGIGDLTAADCRRGSNHGR